MKRPPCAVSRLAKPNAAFRLFVFHHAGGAATQYFDWALPEPSWEIVFVEHPGRGRSVRLPHLVDVAAAVSYFCDHLAPLLDVPFAFFGHSMGGMVAFETAKALVKKGRAPLWLGVSSLPAEAAMGDRLPSFDEADLIQFLCEFGGTPAAVLEHPQFRDLVLDAVRADLKLVLSWKPDVTSKLPVPMSTFVGDDDPKVAAEEMASWRRLASGPVRHHIFSGGHFYLIQESREDVLQTIARDLSDVLGKPVAGPSSTALRSVPPVTVR